MIKLYPHQEKLNNDCRQKLIEGFKYPLIQGATGIGKSVCAADQILKSQKKGKKSLFIVPRKQLVEQMADTFENFGIRFSYIAAGKPFNPYAQTHICSAMTLVNRLETVTPDVVFIDEAHIGGGSLDKIIQHYKALGAYFVFLSATPKRLDGRGLGMWADCMVQGPTIRWLIDNKFLSDYRLFAPSSPDLTGIRSLAGDYDKHALSERMEGDRVLVGDAVTHYRKLAYGKLCVAFCASIRHSQIVAQSFNDAGIPAMHMDGETPMDERRKIIRAFAARELLVLSNVEIMTTGFDLSAAAGVDVTVEAITDLRPTKSLALQLQKWGRGLRKKDQPCIIMDHAGNAAYHGLPCSDRVWSLEDSKKKKKIAERTPPTKQCEACFCIHAPAPSCPECGNVYETKSREIDEIDGELQEISKEQAVLERKREQGRAQTLEELIALGKRRNMKYPAQWAAKVLAGRMMAR